MQITISGFPGSGKTTLGELLSKEYQIPFFSVGDLREEFAKSRGMTIEQLNELGKTNPRTDTEADEYQREWAGKNPDFILDGRLSYHFIPDSIRIFLDVSKQTGAGRIMQNPREDEKKCTTLEEKITANIERCQSDIERYSRIYGISNCYKEENFDIVIDTTNRTPEQVLDLVKKKIFDYNQKMHPPKFYLAHATESRKNVREWEKSFEKRTEIQLVNPFFDCNTEETEFGESGKEKYPKMGEKVASLYEGDLEQIARKDVLGGVVIVDDNWTWGAPAEQATLWLLSKLIYTISLKEDKNYNNHPVLKKYSNHTFMNYEEFEDWVKQNKRNFFRDLEKTRRERALDPVYNLLVHEIKKNQRYIGK